MLNAGIEGERAAVENYPTDVFDKVGGQVWMCVRLAC